MIIIAFECSAVLTLLCPRASANGKKAAVAMATAVSAARTSAEDGATLALVIVAHAAMVSGSFPTLMLMRLFKAMRCPSFP